MSDSSLHGQVIAAIEGRTAWEEKQRIWYEMRHEGLRRQSKPYPTAADLHYPLIDTQIDKQKPFYFNQAFSQERLAFFLGTKPELQEAATSAADYFDYELKNNTAFEVELLSVIDAMLLSGVGVMKVRWDDKAARLVFESVDPLYLIVPQRCDGLDTADFICHVKHLTKKQFELSGVYEVAPEDIKTSSGDSALGDAGNLEEQKAQREGLTFSPDAGLVIVWEVYERTEKGWQVSTYSPAAPDLQLRKPFLLPYKKGDKPFQPFVGFPFEAKDKGWHSPRGIAERLAPFETWATKMWNWKADSIDYLTKPMFDSQGQIVNLNNFRFRPGSIVNGLKPVDMPQPPIALDMEMDKTRMVADELISVPDAGLPTKDSRRERATAAEINYRKALSAQGIELRGRLFRRALGELYNKAWSLLVQFKREDVSYWASEDRMVLPQQAIADAYLIHPSGGEEQWNKQTRYERSIARLQMFSGHPNINQEELAKSVLVEDDVRLVKRLFITNKVRGANEMEDEAMEILLLMAGFPASVTPAEDHALRIQVLAGKLQQLEQLGVPVDPVARQRIQEHMAQHVQMLQQQNPQAAQQIIQLMQEADPTGGDQGTAGPPAVMPAATSQAG